LRTGPFSPGQLAFNRFPNELGSPVLAGDGVDPFGHAFGKADDSRLN
jgi:hypothetical protein